MIYLPYALEGILADSLDNLFYVQSYVPEHSIERLVPNGFVSIVIELDGQERFVYENETLSPKQSCINAWVSGMQTGYLSISALKNTELLAIQIKPGCALPFLHQSIDSFKDQVLPAQEVFGDEILTLRQVISETPAPDQKLALVAQWLQDRYDDSLTTPAPIDAAVRQIMENPTAPTLQAAMTQDAYSSKHFIHLFKKHVGLSPKAFQRIHRFAQVVPLIQEQKEVQWAQISADCGYYDQSHFIKDFLRFSGYNPQSFLDEKHDRPNFFPVDPEADR